MPLFYYTFLQAIPSSFEMLRWCDTVTVLQVAQRGLQGALRGAILCASEARELPTKQLPPRGSMTSQQLLQTARNVLVNTAGDVARNSLQKAALAQGRSQDQVRKASTMRLALWSRGFKSAI